MFDFSALWKSSISLALFHVKHVRGKCRFLEHLFSKFVQYDLYSIPFSNLPAKGRPAIEISQMICLGTSEVHYMT